MQIYIAPYRTTNPQRRFTIRIYDDVITIVINCFNTRWYTYIPLVDDEMLLMMSHCTALGSAFHNIEPPSAKARSANCRRCGAGISCKCADDRKSQRRGITVDFTTRSDKYVGASPLVAL